MLLEEVTNKPLQCQSAYRTPQSVRGISMSENVHHRVANRLLNGRPSTRVRTTDEPAAVPSINRPQSFKLIPVLLPNRDKAANIKSGSQIKMSKSAV